MERGHICQPLMLAILAVCAFWFVCSTDAFEVEVEEVQPSVRRDVPMEGAPHIRHVRFNFDGNDVNLKLKRNAGFKRDFKIYEHVGRNKRELTIKREEGELYHDTENFAAVRMSGVNRRSLHGVFQHEGQAYSIEAVRRNVHTVTPVKVPPTEGADESFDGDEVLMPAEEDITLSLDGVEIPATKKRSAHDKRSSTPPVYDVEVDIVADCTMWRFYLSEASNDATQAAKNLADYITVQVNAGDMVYKLLDPAKDGLSINTFINALHILKSGSACDWTKKYVRHVGEDDKKTVINTVSTLTGLQQWGLKTRTSYSTPDHIMLWTRYDLDTQGQDLDHTSTAGMAYESGICTPKYARSVIEDTGYSTWRTMAHELAHSLGSPHDGLKGSAACSAGDSYLMSPDNTKKTQTNIGNTFKFSPCSIAEMKRVLSGDADKYPRLCVTNRVCSDAGADINRDVSQLVGIGFKPHAYCADRHGRGFYQDSSEESKNSMCFKMTCTKTGSSSEMRMLSLLIPKGAPDGADCGGSTDKWCRSGSCVSKASNPAPSAGGSSSCTPTPITKTAPATCTNDARVKLNFDGDVLGCSAVPLRNPTSCINHAGIAKYCCKACSEAGLI